MTVPRSAWRTTMPGSAAPSRLRGPTRGPVLVPALALAFGLGACEDRPLTAPLVDAPISTKPSAAVFVAPDPVDIAPNGTSSTGIPLMTVDVVFDEGVVSMNNHHVILGNATSPTHFFTSPMLWTGGSGLVDLMPDRPYTPGAYGHDINDANAVVGVGAGAFINLGVGWVLDGNGLHTLPNPPNYDGLGFGGRNIAEDGTAHVFYFRNSPSGNTGAVISPPYTASDYTAIPLGNPSSGTTQHVNAQDVEGGLVVGGFSGQAWTWAPGDPALSFIDGLFGDATNGTDIVGRARFDGAIHAAILGGTAQDLGTLGGTFSVPTDVNALGWVAGWGPDAGGQNRGFAWRPGQATLTDLGTLDGDFASQALAIDDHGHVLGTSSSNTAPHPSVVIWFPFEAANTAPDIQPIVSPVATVGEPFLLEPVVIDAEGDPFTLSWSGDIPPGAVINGIFAWTPTADDIGTYEITVTATQDDDPTLTDSETFALSVVAAATPQADLQVSLAPDAIQQRVVGEAIAYTATVHNAGPDAVVASIQVEAEFSEQSNWGGTQEPPPEEGVINGIYSLALGEVPAGETVHVPFEVVFEAFGTQQLSATVAGNHDDSDPGNDIAALSEAVDLPLSTPGLEFAALGVPGASTTDGEPLVVVGVRVPAALVAGTEPGMPDMFVPATVTPGVLAGAQYVPGDGLIVGDSYLPGNRALAGGEVVPGDVVIAGDAYVPGAQYLPDDAFSQGDAYVPTRSLWLEGTARLAAANVPPGRLLFDNGAGTDLLVPSLGDTELTLGRTATGPLAIGAGGGGGKVSVDLCGGGYSARLGDGDAGTFACGSLTVKTLTGEIVVVLADGTTVTVLAGASVQITENTEGGFDVEILAGTEDDVLITPPAANAPPDADAGGPYVVAVGADLSLDGTASSDPDGDPLAYAWVLGDGGSTSLLAEGPTPTLTAPLVAGLYSVTLTVTDPGDLSSSATVEVAVYDPDGASVAGGGWYHSPAGALVADPAAEGRATFAFHARYRKGASVPDGSARLVFEAGDLRLTSDVFEWLIVGGSMARFRGVGHLDGREDPVRFEIVGRDPDEVRVRIWDDAGEIYDSGSVQIAGGRVVVKG